MCICACICACQDVDAHEEMVDELGLMLIERRRCNKVTLEHMPLHQTNGACMYVFKPATSAVQAALLTHISQAADCQRLTSETAQLKSLLGAVQTVLQFLDLRKMALTTNSIGGWMRLEMGVEGEETMCERFCVCVSMRMRILV